MKTKILSYSLIFTALLALFLYVNNASIYEYQIKKIELKSNKIEKLKDSIGSLLEKNSKATYFSLAKNQRASAFHSPKLASEVKKHIQSRLSELDTSHQWSKIIGLSRSKKQWVSNTFAVVNHQWVLVEVTDGDQWMEVLLQYTFDSQSRVDFSLISKATY